MNPDTFKFNDDINVVLAAVLVNIAPLNIAGNLTAPSVVVQSNWPDGLRARTEFVAFCVNLALSPIKKALALRLLRPNNRAAPCVASV